METVYLLVPLACLAGAVLAGLLGWKIGRIGAHTVAILGVAVAFLAFHVRGAAGRARG